MGVRGGVVQGVLGVWGAGGILARGRPRKQASNAKARLKGKRQGREVSWSPKEGAHTCGICKFPDWGVESQPLEKHCCGVLWGATWAVRGLSCPEVLRWSQVADSPGSLGVLWGGGAPPGGLLGKGSRCGLLETVGRSVSTVA